MADFCSCGSLMLNGQCSNKNCSSGAAVKASKASGSRTKSSSRAPGKRRTSKVVTYNLYEDSDREEDD